MNLRKKKSPKTGGGDANNSDHDCMYDIMSYISRT